MEMVARAAHRLHMFDFRPAAGDLVASIPSVSSLAEDAASYGVRRLAALLKARGVWGHHGDLLVLQFSSFPRLIEKWLRCFVELVAGEDTARRMNERVKIVFPTSAQVEKSLNPGGFGMPGKKEHINVPFLKPMLCGVRVARGARGEVSVDSARKDIRRLFQGARGWVVEGEVVSGHIRQHFPVRVGAHPQKRLL